MGSVPWRSSDRSPGGEWRGETEPQDSGFETTVARVPVRHQRNHRPSKRPRRRGNEERCSATSNPALEERRFPRPHDVRPLASTSIDHPFLPAPQTSGCGGLLRAYFSASGFRHVRSSATNRPSFRITSPSNSIVPPPYSGRWIITRSQWISEVLPLFASSYAWPGVK